MYLLVLAHAIWFVHVIRYVPLIFAHVIPIQDARLMQMTVHAIRSVHVSVTAAAAAVARAAGIGIPVNSENSSILNTHNSCKT